MKYDIFISYRREGGYDTAKHLNDLLVRDGYKVSFDIDTLRSGNFDAQLLSRIDQCKDFILIVDQHAFDRTLDPNFDPKKDWLRSELAFALKKDKNVIPVFLAGVNGFPDNLPSDIAGIIMKNGPEYNRYHFNAFYADLKKRFLHKRALYRQKKSILFSFLILSIFSCLIYQVLYKKAANEYLSMKGESPESEIAESLPDYKDQIREKFENMPDMDPSDRADIVDVIKAFTTIDGAATIQSWDVFSEFTKRHQLIPLSQGVEWEEDSAILPFRLDYISKLVYKGKNLDSDIHGQSSIQDIYIGGPRAGIDLLVISTTRASYDVGEKVDEIIKDAEFSRLDYKRHMDVSYEIYKNKKKCYLVLTCSGGSGGNFYEWIISPDRDLIVKYLGNLDIFNLTEANVE